MRRSFNHVARAAVLLAAALSFSYSACGNDEEPEPQIDVCRTTVKAEPCGEAAQVGGGTAPVIRELEVPACFDEERSSLQINIAATDVDGDLATFTATVPALGEGGVEATGNLEVLPDGSEKARGSVTFVIDFEASPTGKPIPGEFQVRVFVSDTEGNQSAPYCATVRF